MPRHLLSSLLFFLTASSHLTSAACFLPNGTDINRSRLGNVPWDHWLPCSNNGGMCCRLNDTSPDTCTGQGLCHNDVAPHLWRESCSDREWGGDCLQLCVAATGINTGNPNWPNGTPLRNSHVPITECQDGSFCCGKNNTNCCSQSRGSFIVNGQVTTSKPSSTSTTSSSTTSPTSPAASSSPSTSSSNTGAIAGGVVGGIAGLLLILGALWFFMKKRKRRRVDERNVVQQPQRPAFSEMESSEQQKHELVGEGMGMGYKKIGQSRPGGLGEEVHELDAAGGR